MKVRKKPIIVDAELYDGSKESIAKIASLGYGVKLYSDHLIIKTLEGNHRANIGDWIIKGVKGELYPCKPDIFERTYEVVKDGEKSCVRCGRTEQIEEHHIVELSSGGEDNPSNKELRCQPCHKLEHAMRLIRSSLHFEKKRVNPYLGIGDASGKHKERVQVYERRLKALARLNTPSLIRKRGTYLSYWGDTSLHRLPRRIRSKTEEAVDMRINLVLEQAMEKARR